LSGFGLRAIFLQSESPNGSRTLGRVGQASVLFASQALALRLHPLRGQKLPMR
jgi:hypothetical protein